MKSHSNLTKAKRKTTWMVLWRGWFFLRWPDEVVDGENRTSDASVDLGLAPSPAPIRVQSINDVDVDNQSVTGFGFHGCRLLHQSNSKRIGSQRNRTAVTNQPIDSSLFIPPTITNRSGSRSYSSYFYIDSF